MKKDYYESKLGCKFRIVDFHKPPEGDIAHFTREEFSWLKARCNAEEFKVIWMLKMGDYTYDPIPDEEKPPVSISQKYSQEIINQLRYPKQEIKECSDIKLEKT